MSVQCRTCYFKSLLFQDNSLREVIDDFFKLDSKLHSYAKLDVIQGNKVCMSLLPSAMCHYWMSYGCSQYYRANHHAGMKIYSQQNNCKLVSISSYFQHSLLGKDISN